MFKLSPEVLHKLKLVADGFGQTESAVCQEALQRFIAFKLDEAKSRLALRSLEHLSAADRETLRRLN